MYIYSIKFKYNIVFAILLLLLNIFNFSYATNIYNTNELNYNKDYNSDNKIVITIDPGHGGSETGTMRHKYLIGDEIICEKDINLYVSNKIYNYLKLNSNFNIYMTRYDDTKISLSDRGKIAGLNNSDLMLSIHFNNVETNKNSFKAMGTEIWQSVVDIYKPLGLPDLILKELNKNHFVQTVRGTRERISSDTYWNYELNNYQYEDNGYVADYYGIIKSGCINKVPTIILENCFISNDLDFNNIINDKYLDELAERISIAIIKYYS